MSGAGTTINGVTLLLSGVASSDLSAWGLLLVDPSGHAFVPMAGAGGSAGFSGVNLTLSDGGGASLSQSAAPVTGTFRPSAYTALTFAAPAPASDTSAAPAGTATFLSAFGGDSANGTWELFSKTTASGASGSIANGWCVNVTSSTPAPGLGIAATHSPSPLTQGSTGAITLKVSNTGNATTSGVTTVTDTLPSGVDHGNPYSYTMSSYSGTGWTCTGTGTNSVSCTSSTAIAASGSSTIVLNVNVPATSPITVSNTASAYGGGDPVHTSSGTAASGTDSSVPVTQVPASITVAAGGTQSALTGAAFTTPLTVLVTDAAGVAIPNQSVTFTAPSSGPSGAFSNSTASITAITASTGTVGQLAETFTANGTAGGPYSVTATAGSVTTSPAFSLTNVAPPVANSVVVTGYPSPVYVGVAHTGTVTVDDQYGNPLTTYSGSATITTSDTAATVTTPVTIANGTGTFTVPSTRPAHRASLRRSRG